MADLKKMVGFLVTTNPDAARRFYTEVLGFRLHSDDVYALAFDTPGALLRILRNDRPRRGAVPRHLWPRRPQHRVRRSAPGR